MDPNYYDSIVKNIPPELFIDETFQIAEEVEKAFVSTFNEPISKIAQKLIHINPTEIPKREERNIHFEINFNKSQPRFAFGELNITIGKGYSCLLDYYNNKEIQKNDAILCLELELKSEKSAKQFISEIEHNILPRESEFVYYQFFKKFNGQFKFLQNNNKVCLAIWRKAETIKEVNKVINQIPFDKFDFGLQLNGLISSGLIFSEIKDLSLDNLLKQLMNISLSIDTKGKNYRNIAQAARDVFSEYKDNELMGKICNWLVTVLMVSKLDVSFDADTNNYNFRDFLKEYIFVSNQAYDKVLGSMREGLGEFHELIFDILQNICKKLGISSKFDEVTNFVLGFFIPEGKSKILLNIKKKGRLYSKNN